MSAEGVEPLAEGVSRRPRPPGRSGPVRPSAPRRRVRVEDARGDEEGLDRPRLDLHGLSAADAVAELRRFLELNRSSRRLRLEVVTGRGRHSGDGRSAVAEAVEEWLAFSLLVARLRRTAGGGALLVDLKGPGRR